jgi:hypothetical protein
MQISQEESMRCPSCGGVDVRKSLTRSLADAIPGVFGFAALRCRSCRRRFYRRLESLRAAAASQTTPPGAVG